MNMLEHMINGNKELEELFKSYTGIDSRELGKEIYNRGVLPHHKKTTIKAYISMVASVALYAGSQFLENPNFKVPCFLGLGFTGVSTILYALELLSIEASYDHLMKQAKAHAGKVIKKRLEMN